MQKFRLKILFLIFIFFIIPIIVNAIDPISGYHIYTVKKDGTGDCTTIQACVNVAVAGDTILVYPGEYSGPITISKSGVIGNPIIIKSQIQFGAVIANGGFNISGKYITIDGFEITGSGGGVTITGGSSNIIVQNNKIHDFSGTGFFLGGHTALISDIIIQGNEIYNGHHDGIDLWGDTSNILIAHNHMHDFTVIDSDHVDAIQAYGPKGTSNNNITIHGNYFHNIVHEGILFKDFPTNNLIVEDNIVFTSGWDMYIFQTTGATIQHNTMRYLYFDPGNSNIILVNNILSKLGMLNGASMSEFISYGYNLVSEYQGYIRATTDLTGNPTFAGGLTPTTWAGYKLIDSSLGYRSASDGLDVGATYFGDVVMPPDTTPPSAPSGVIIK